jgi:hypothetical protein
MRAKVALVAAVLAVSRAGQVTERAQSPLFWVSSVRSNPAGADQTSPFEFHWDVGTNPGNAPEKLESYFAIVFYFGSREEHKGADPRGRPRALGGFQYSRDYSELAGGAWSCARLWAWRRAWADRSF